MASHFKNAYVRLLMDKLEPEAYIPPSAIMLYKEVIAEQNLVQQGFEQYYSVTGDQDDFCGKEDIRQNINNYLQSVGQRGGVVWPDMLTILKLNDGVSYAKGIRFHGVKGILRGVVDAGTRIQRTLSAAAPKRKAEEARLTERLAVED